MTNNELNQPAQAAVATSAANPSDGERLQRDELDRLMQECFSYEAITRNLGLWNRAAHFNMEKKP